MSTRLSYMTTGRIETAASKLRSSWASTRCSLSVSPTGAQDLPRICAAATVDGISRRTPAKAPPEKSQLRHRVWQLVTAGCVQRKEGFRLVSSESDSAALAPLLGHRTIALASREHGKIPGRPDNPSITPGASSRTRSSPRLPLVTNIGSAGSGFWTDPGQIDPSVTWNGNQRRPKATDNPRV